MHIFFLKMYILHLLEKTSPPFILYLDFTVRTTGPLKVPEDSMCFQGACFRNELTSSKIKNKLGFFFIMQVCIIITFLLHLHLIRRHTFDIRMRGVTSWSDFRNTEWNNNTENQPKHVSLSPDCWGLREEAYQYVREKLWNMIA